MGCWWMDMLSARVVAGFGESLLTGEVQGAAKPSHGVWTGAHKPASKPVAG